MGLDITFVKNNKENKHYKREEILYFRKRYDILGSVLVLDKNENFVEEDAVFMGSCDSEQLLDRNDIECLAQKYEELKLLLEYDEVICWWVG